MDDREPVLPNDSILANVIDLFVRLVCWPLIGLIVLVAVYAVPLIGIFIAIGWIIRWRRKAAIKSQLANADAVRIAVREAMAERDAGNLNN